MTSRPDDPAAPPRRPLTLVADGQLADLHEVFPINPAQVMAPVVLVPSVEPGVVFSSLTARCVPELCDACTIEVVEGPHIRYRVESPSQEALTGGLQRLADRAGDAPGQHVRVPFAHLPSAQASPDDAQLTLGRDDFHGVATFTWLHRTPSRADHTLAAVLVDHAVRTVLWQRSDSAATAAADYIGHLRLALESNRDIGAAIGILMSQHKITQSRAVEMLRAVSQHTNRKVRDLALEVIDTGWLDPATADTSGPGRDASSSTRTGGS